MLLPGCGKLATKPLPIGSATSAKTMGMVRVCCSSAAVAGVLCERMRSGCSATSSFANRRIDSSSPGAAQRVSIRMLRPSVHPSFWSPSRNAATRPVLTGRSRQSPSARRCVAPIMLLCARSKRPRCRGTTNKANEIASPHCPSEAGGWIVAGQSGQAGSGQNRARQCPLWVTSGHGGRNLRCLLYPRKRTFIAAVGMSALGQSGH